MENPFYILHCVPDAEPAQDISELMALFHCMVRFSTVHFWGVFHWVQYLVLF